MFFVDVDGTISNFMRTILVNLFCGLDIKSLSILVQGGQEEIVHADPNAGGVCLGGEIPVYYKTIRKNPEIHGKSIFSFIETYILVFFKL